MITAFFFLFGAIWGSFANVVILRLPRGESIAFPASHCGSCKTPIRWFHNLPILGWLILRGKCATCKKPFSVRYLIVEVLMAGLFAFCYEKFGLSWNLLEYLVFVFGLVTVSFIDLDHMILPDVFTLSGIVLGLLGAAVNPDATRTMMQSFLGVLLGGGFLWAVAEVYFRLRKKEGMGGGDIKLLAWIGAILGWSAIPFVILVSSIMGSVVGLILGMRSKEGLQKMIPFGPYIALAALLYLLFDGDQLSQWYLRLHGL